MTIDDLKALLVAAREFLAFVASMTTTRLDDELVSFLDAVIGSPILLEWLYELIASLLRDDEIITVGIQAAKSRVLHGWDSYNCADRPAGQVKSEMAAAGIDWIQLIGLLPIVLDMVRRFRG